MRHSWNELYSRSKKFQSQQIRNCGFWGFLAETAAGHSLPEAVEFLLPEMGIESRSRTVGYKTNFSGINQRLSNK